MRRVAHFVAPILIVITTVIGSVAARSLAHLTPRGHGVFDALALPLAGQVATESTSRRLTAAAAEFDRAEFSFLPVSSVAAAAIQRIGRVDAPLSTVARPGFEPDTARDRAPPSSR